MSSLFDELLRVRGLERSFLTSKYEECVDPFLLPDMDKAAKRIQQAVKNQEKVLIYGDYDVDGVTASTVMHETLKLAGVKELEIMLPNRFTDGYGMSKKIVQRVQDDGFSLVVTVDCGSRNHEIITQLNEAGIDTIVTDHHECGDNLPSAIAVINPKRQDWSLEDYSSAESGSEVAERLLRESPQVTTEDEAARHPRRRAGATAFPAEDVQQLRDLAGVGVAFKLAQALVKVGLIPEGQEKWLLDLVLIGTVCDSMQLTGENRRLCYYGFKVLEKTRRPGIKELMKVACVTRLNAESVAFQIGPRLNAAGRMDTAEAALKLLLAAGRVEAAKLAAELDHLNSLRRQQQTAAMDEINRRGVSGGAVIVEKGDWHEGVLGIIAGKLLEQYHRPAFVLSPCAGQLKGSGRSFGEFNLAEALNACAKYTLGGGGHAEACGVKLSPDSLEDFRQEINRYYESLHLKNQERFFDTQEDLKVDDFADLSLEFIDELALLEPYGMGNAEPIFLLSEVRVVDVAKLGNKGQHLRLTVWDCNGKSLKLINFNAPEEYLRLEGGELVNVWISLAANEYRGLRSVEGRIVKLAVI